MAKIDYTSNLDPFKLHFDIYSGNPGYYFISTPFNYDIHTNTEEVDLSKWAVDAIIDVYVEKKTVINYKFTKRIYGSPSNTLHIRYEYNTKNQKLKIWWADLGLEYGSKLVIKFYSLSQQREKLLNELFTPDEE